MARPSQRRRRKRGRHWDRHWAEKTVNLIVEVDPISTPKKLLSNVVPVLLAENYTVSYGFESFKVKDTVVIFVTALDGRPRSPKEAQFRLIEHRIKQKFNLPCMGTKSIHLCFGRTMDEAAQECLARSHSEDTGLLVHQLVVFCGAFRTWGQSRRTQHCCPPLR